MKAVIYARVSTEEQKKKGYSLNAQIRKCKEYCKVRDWEVVDVIKEVKSAREKRSGLLKAIEMVKLGVADIMVAWKLDRIVRSSIDFANIVSQIGYNFATVIENLDGTTPYGRFAMKIIVDVAELESETLSDRVKLGLEAAKMKGKQIGWKKGRPRINPEKKQQIIEMYRQGATYREIREKLGVANGTITRTLRQAGLIE